MRKFRQHLNAKKIAHRPINGLVDILERHGSARRLTVRVVVRVRAEVARSHDSMRVRGDLEGKSV